jgi:L-threonylcarbamoyladenylate synthase
LLNFLEGGGVASSPQIVRASKDSIAQAATLLGEGELVAFPTETVYGLGADATNDAAVAKVFQAKNRPSINPLIVHVNGISMALDCGEFGEAARNLAEAFWPGPLTLIVPRKELSPISSLASAGLDTVAIRMPDHPVAQELISEVKKPIAAPSANISGTVSPTTAQHVADSLGDRVKLILDGGKCRIGIESTIVRIATDGPHILRPGGISREQLEQTLDHQTFEFGKTTTECAASPGLIGCHYAPRHSLRLNTCRPKPREALLAFGPDQPDIAGRSLNLSPTGNLREAAANLFSMLRELDKEDCTAIAVMPIPSVDLGAAINDRLRRAAKQNNGTPK